MPAADPADLARTLRDAVNAPTVARGRTRLLQRRLDALADDRDAGTMVVIDTIADPEATVLSREIGPVAG